MEWRLLVVLAGWGVGWVLLWRVPRLGRGALRRPEPADDLTADDLTVVIPARNETASLPHLLASLQGAAVRPGQILVIDDQSTDDTAALARAVEGVTLIEGEPLPEGWTGKSWACQQGVSLATGSELVFVDADVTFGPDGLDAVRRELHDRGGLVSVQPFHRMRRAYERYSAFFNVIGMMGVGAAGPGRAARSDGAFGPVLACRREDYERVGGHAGVRGELVEDIALARAFARHGLPVHTFGGRGSDVGATAARVSFRMYPDGIGQLVEGWSKNIATGAGTVRLPRLLAIGFWVACVLVSVQGLIELAAAARFGGDVTTPIVVLLYGIFVVQFLVMLRQLGNFGPLASIGYPALAGVFLVVFVRSAWITLVRRRVRWRGRTIPIGRGRPARRGAPAPEGDR